MGGTVVVEPLMVGPDGGEDALTRLQACAKKL